MGGEPQDPRPLGAPALHEPAGRLDAVEDRHADVHEHHVRAELDDAGDGLLAVRADADRGHVRLRVHDAGEAVPHEGLVVDHDDPDRRGRVGHGVLPPSGAVGHRAWRTNSSSHAYRACPP